MQNSIFYWAGLLLTAAGATISVVFWLPGILDRKRLKEMLGDRYPVVFVIYVANGPVLLLLGLLMLFRFH